MDKDDPCKKRKYIISKCHLKLRLMTFASAYNNLPFPSFSGRGKHDCITFDIENDQKCITLHMLFISNEYHLH